MILIDEEWKELLKDEIHKEYFIKLLTFVRDEYENKRIFPKQEDIFNALNYCSYDDIRVVIIGQDPYHQEGQAHGLCFSVKEGMACPPSLQNIKKELKNEYNFPITRDGCLQKWAKQGVLLLNSILTVQKDHPMSHANQGWEIFTKKILELVCQKQTPVVFIAWGASARNVLNGLPLSNHLVLTSAHPSPLSAYNGFFFSNVFIKTNEFLKNNNLKEIDWEI